MNGRIVNEGKIRKEGCKLSVQKGYQTVAIFQYSAVNP